MMRAFFILLVLSFLGGNYAMDLNNSTHQNDTDTKSEATTKNYLVFPKDRSDPNLIAHVKSTIQSVIGHSKVASRSKPDGKFKWHSVHLTPPQLAKLQEEASIDEIVENISAEIHRAVPVENSTESGDWGKLSSRDEQEYRYSDDSPEELVIISTPPGHDLGVDAEYWYPSEAGEGIFIYHIEHGITKGSGYELEFGDRIQPPLNSDEDYDSDATIHARKFHKRESDPLHGTCVAEKAIGKTNGVARKASLVPMVLDHANADGFSRALDMIYNDIKHHTGRYKKSIVMFSMGFTVPAEERENGLWKDIKASMNAIFDIGVPIVVSAGNRRPTQDSFVNELPAIWRSTEFPLITAGNANAKGVIHWSSRTGPQVAVYLDGVNNRCACYSDKETATGTSFSCPQLAGGLAVFMSQKQGPFKEATENKSGTRGFVIAVDDFIQKQASYKHAGGALMFWNMVPKKVMGL